MEAKEVPDQIEECSSHFYSGIYHSIDLFHNPESTESQSAGSVPPGILIERKGQKDDFA
jgi:hypothetical protein